MLLVSAELVVSIIWTTHPWYLVMQRCRVSELSGLSKNPCSVHPSLTIFSVNLVCLKT